MNKKLLLILALAVLIITFLFGALILFKKFQIDSTFTVIKEDGRILYKSSAQGSYIETSADEQDFTSGTFLKTDAESSAHVVLPDNSVVSLDENTEVQINFSQNNYDIQQFVGKTWNRVESVGKGGSYQVSTPTTIAAVRGTIFGVDYQKSDNDDSTSDIYVQESNVDVSTKGKNTPVKLSEGETSETTNIKGRLETLKDQIKDTLKNSNWFKRNLILDAIVKDSKANRLINLRRDLRSKILEKIEDLKTLKTSSNKTIQQKLLDRNSSSPLFDQFINIPTGDASVLCQAYSGQSYESIVSTLETLAEQYPTLYTLPESTLNKIKAISVACQDNILTSQELTEIDSIQ